MQKEKLEMEERITKEKLLFQEKENDREEKDKKRRYQLEIKELEMQDKFKAAPLPLDPAKHFDVAKHIRLVPPFQEKERSGRVVR